MPESIQNVLSEIASLEGIASLSYLPNLLLILLILVLLWIGTKVFDLFSSYSLEHQLVKEDNKAVTITFVAYLAGLAIIMEGVLEGNFTVTWMEFFDVFIWSIIGNVLLLVAGKINDKILLRKIDNKVELLENRNLAVGAVEVGSFIGSAVIIRSIILGESLGWALDIGLTVLYFILAQVFFYIYTMLYQKMIKYDFQEEIKKGNVAAGISLGFNLIALGMLLAIPLRNTFSIVFFLAWFLVGSATMAFFRFVMDRIIIPQEKLDEEIHKDENWGIAFLEGCFSVTAIVVLQSIFV
ncbi:MAG: DUF350 domain-containing protein [Deltaproteobacteria bacterium]|nr:DUF350 domain-containing protein [Deltaproteobacteria bacterium]